jgi:hypothetical protein
MGGLGTARMTPLPKLVAISALACTLIAGLSPRALGADTQQKSPDELRQQVANIEDTKRILAGPPIKMAEELANCAGVMDAASYVMKMTNTPNAAKALREHANGYAISAMFVMSSTDKNADASKWVNSIEESKKTAMLAAIEIGQQDILRQNMAHCREVVQPISEAFTDEIRKDYLYRKSVPTNK